MVFSERRSGPRTRFILQYYLSIHGMAGSALALPLTSLVYLGACINIVLYMYWRYLISSTARVFWQGGDLSLFQHASYFNARILSRELYFTCRVKGRSAEGKRKDRLCWGKVYRNVILVFAWSYPES